MMRWVSMYSAEKPDDLQACLVWSDREPLIADWLAGPGLFLMAHSSDCLQDVTHWARIDPPS